MSDPALGLTMLALIVVVCIAAITALGSNANGTFTTISTTVGS